MIVDNGQAESNQTPTDKMMAALNLEQPSQPEEEAASEGEAVTEEVNTAESEETQPDTESVSEEPEEEGQPEDENDLEYLFEVDGEKVTKDEAKLGYMRDKDYRHKTMALADMRNKTESAQRQAGVFLKALMDEAQKGVSQYANVEWERLALEDPAAYKQHRPVYEDAKRRAESYQRQAKAMLAQEQEYEQARLKSQAVESVKRLKLTIPNWSNELYGQVRNYAVEQGFTADEFNRIADHRVIRALHAQMQLDSGKSVVTDKLAKPSASKHIKSTATGKNLERARSMKKAREAVKTGKTARERENAAIDLMMEKFGGKR